MDQVDALGAWQVEARWKSRLLRVGPVVRPVDLAPVIEQRLAEYGATQPYLLPRRPETALQGDACDTLAFTFAAYHDSTLVGSMRLSPDGCGDVHPRDLLDAAELAAMAPGPLLQAGRLQVLRSYRGQGVADLICYAALLWCGLHTRYRSYYAVAQQRFAPMYLAFGARPITTRAVTIPGRPGAYMALQGNVLDTVQAIHRRLTERSWHIEPGPPRGASFPDTHVPAEPVAPYAHRLGSEPRPACVLIQRSDRVLYLDSPDVLVDALVQRVRALTRGESVDRVILGRAVPDESAPGQATRLAAAFPGATIDDPSSHSPRPLGGGLYMRRLRSASGDRLVVNDELTGQQWGYDS